MSMREVKDPAYIKEIAQIMKSHGLTKVSINEDNRKQTEVVLERHHSDNSHEKPSGPIVTNSAGNVQSAVFLDEPVTSINSGADDLSDLEDCVKEIMSPIVGVFYDSSSPEGNPFVYIGDIIEKGDTLCVLEALKVKNEIKAEYGGKIIDICAKNGDVIEFGQVLFKIDVS